MSRDATAERMRALVRDVAFLGGERPVSEDQALARLGGGLDSLALVELLAGVEAEFGIDLPESMWSGSDTTTLGDVIDYVHGREPTRTKPKQRGSPPSSLVDKVRATLRDRGLVRGGADLAARGLLRAVRPLYSGQPWVILSRDLEAPLPSMGLLGGLELRPADGDISKGLDSWEPARQRAHLAKLLAERRAAGHICLTAWSDGRLAGVDWIVPRTYPDPVAGLRIEVEPGSCLGLDLREHAEHRGQGVGLALLSYSLHEARRRGFRRQVTLVVTANTHMRVAAAHALGFSEVGRVMTHTVAGRPMARWRLGEDSGWGVLRV